MMDEAKRQIIFLGIMCLAVGIMCAWCAKSTCACEQPADTGSTGGGTLGSLQGVPLYSGRFFYRGRLSNEVQNPVHSGNGGTGGDFVAKTPTTIGRTARDTI